MLNLFIVKSIANIFRNYFKQIVSLHKVVLTQEWKGLNYNCEMR